MPLFDFQVDGTGERFEELFRAGEEVPEVLVSSHGRIARRLPPLIAATPGKWGDTPHNRRHFNRGLQCWVDGDKDAERIAASRGLRSARELGDDTDLRNLSEGILSRRKSYVQGEVAEQAEYQANLARTGDHARAVAETWSPQRIFAGDTVYAKEGAP